MARETGAVDGTIANDWESPFVFALNKVGGPCHTGDAAMGADPQDPESIAGAIRDVVENPTLREQLAVRGLQRAARFSWQNTAREMFAVYRELVPRAS